MTYQENRNKGGRPKAVKGKARTKTISTRLTLAEWESGHETDYRCGQETVTLPA